MNILWQSFLEHLARSSSRGAFRTHDGIRAAWVHSDFIITNATFLSSPVSGESDLRGRLQAAVQDAGAHGLPWALYTYEPFLAGVAPGVARSVVAEFGLDYLLRVRVMTADCRVLEPPIRPLTNIETRRIETREDIWRALEINMRAYSMPVEMADSVLETGAFFSNPGREFGFLGLVDGQVVSTASVVEIEGWLYVFLVATDSEHRRQGYAEAVMRHALTVASSELGITRTSLDASDAGAPLYSQMGYRHTGEEWGVYLPA